MDNEQLNIDHNQARALHRIVRAMHDGECPNCHNVFDSREMVRLGNGGIRLGWKCPECHFELTNAEATEIYQLFGKFMNSNLEVFLKWRQERSDRLNG